MKKVLFALFAILAVCACGGGNTSSLQSTQPNTDSVHADTTVFLAGKGKMPYCKINLKIVYFTDKKFQVTNSALMATGLVMPAYYMPETTQKGMPRFVDTFMKRYADDYLKTFAPLYQQDREHATAYTQIYEVKTRVENPENGVLNYIGTIFTQGGGPYGTTITWVRNIDVQTGKILKLDDVFVPGYEKRLNELLLKALQAKFGVNSLEGLQQKGITLAGGVYAPQNFILGNGETTFIYCEQEIAPHAVGEIRLTFDNDDLSDLWKRSN